MFEINGQGQVFFSSMEHLDLRAGDGASSPITSSAIFVRDCGPGSDVQLTKCRVEHMWKGVAVLSSYNFDMLACTVTANQPSVPMQSVIIAMGLAGGGFGIWLADCTDSVIDGCDISGLGYYQNGAPMLTEPWRTGVCVGAFPPCDLISMPGGSRNSIRNNAVSHGNAAGVFIFEMNGVRGHDHRVHGNHVSLMRQHGLDISYQDDIWVYENFVEHVEEAGLGMADCARAFVWLNTIAFSQDAVAPCRVPPPFSASMFILWGTRDSFFVLNIVGGSAGLGSGPAHSIIFHHWPGSADPFNNLVGSPWPNAYENAIFAGESSLDPHVLDPLGLNLIGFNHLF